MVSGLGPLWGGGYKPPSADRVGVGLIQGTITSMGGLISPSLDLELFDLQNQLLTDISSRLDTLLYERPLEE
jgi:hypothetical protein